MQQEINEEVAAQLAAMRATMEAEDELDLTAVADLPIDHYMHPANILPAWQAPADELDTNTHGIIGVQPFLPPLPDATGAVIEADDGWIAAMLAQMEDEDNEPWRDPFPPLYRAIAGPPGTAGEQGDNEERVRQLLAEGANIDMCTEQGWTPLMVSASTGQPHLTRLLLRAGANLKARDKNGNGAIEWALHRVNGFDDDVVLELEIGPENEKAASLLRLAGQQWSPANHFTFPDAERQRAVDLLWIGAALAKRPVRSDEAHEEVEPVEALGRAFFDVWMAYLLPLAVLRPEGELVTYCS